MSGLLITVAVIVAIALPLGWVVNEDMTTDTVTLRAEDWRCVASRIETGTVDETLVPLQICHNWQRISS